MEKRELLNEILVILKENHPYKAKHLIKLIQMYDNESDPGVKRYIERKISGYIYNLFTTMLSRDCASRLNSLNCTINELSYQIERHYNYDWRIVSDGVYKARLDQDNNVVIDSKIPRTYLGGFNINKATNKNEETVNFYMDNVSRLDAISDCMDRKLELVTDGFEFRGRKISMKLVDLLQKFIGFKTLTPEEQERRKNKIVEFKN